MNDFILTWIERSAACPGVLACGARLPDRSFVARSCREEIPQSRMLQAMRDLSQAVYALQQNRLPADRLRWRFENGQVLCASRPGGVIAALLLAPESAELPEIEQLLADFVKSSI